MLIGSQVKNTYIILLTLIVKLVLHCWEGEYVISQWVTFKMDKTRNSHVNLFRNMGANIRRNQ